MRASTANSFFLAISLLWGTCRGQENDLAEEIPTTVEVISVVTETATVTKTLAPKPTPKIENNRTITITNHCDFPMYPAVLTSAGEKPYVSGFLLPEGASRELWVSHDWIGRIWGRTNCTWGEDSDGKIVGKCLTGDCGGVLECEGGTGEPPATLAEFALLGHEGLSFYDISLVDGWNLDMEIIPEHGAQSTRNEISPKCVATKAENSKWCPWDNQYFLEEPLEDKVFVKPNDNKPRPNYNPCLSACALTGSDEYEFMLSVVE